MNPKMERPLPHFFCSALLFSHYKANAGPYPTSISLSSIESFHSARVPARNSMSWMLPVGYLLYQYASAFTSPDSQNQGCSAMFIR